MLLLPDKESAEVERPLAKLGPCSSTSKPRPGANPPWGPPAATGDWAGKALELAMLVLMLMLVLPYTECVEGARPWLTPEFWGVSTGEHAEVQFGKLGCYQRSSWQCAHHSGIWWVSIPVF